MISVSRRRTTGSRYVAQVLALVLAAGGAIGARAQSPLPKLPSGGIKTLPTIPVKIPPKQVTPGQVSNGNVAVRIRNLPLAGFSVSGQSRQPTLTIDGQGNALSAFYLRFDNGAHKVARLSLLRFPGTVQPAINDNDGNDPFTASARYVDVGVANTVTVRAACSGTCDLPMEPISTTQTALISGFSFERPDGDNNIRRIAVQLRPERRVAVVSFVDDGGLEIHSTPQLSIVIGRNDRRAYNVTLQYVVIDAAHVREFGHASGTRRTGTPWPGSGTASAGSSVAPSGYGWSVQGAYAPPHALQAFDFSFTNSDHFLREFGINLARRGEVIAFQDDDRGDGIDWNVDYAVLKRIGEQ